MATSVAVWANSWATASQNGTALLAAYAAAKLLTPGGNALSASNRAAVIVPPGTYDLGTSTLTLDTDFVDLIALFPILPGPRFAADASGWIEYIDVGVFTYHEGTGFRPTNVVLTSSDDTSTNAVAICKQTADDVRVVGISFYNQNKWCDPEDPAIRAANAYGFVIDATDNSNSVYWGCSFYHRYASIKTVCSLGDLGGEWHFCVAGDYPWYPQSTYTLKARMFHCVGGFKSFGGDDLGGAGTATISGRFEHCRAVGVPGEIPATPSGSQSFSGCGEFGIPITAAAVFIDCEAGDNSFGMGKECAGTFYNCRAGTRSFGGYDGSSASKIGSFTGKAYDCIASERSFGIGENAASKCTGELHRCIVTAAPVPMRIEGAQIYDSIIQVTGTDQHCLTLLDSLSVVDGCTLIANGTGNSFYAGSVLNVQASFCKTNADKHGNVTNLLGAGTLAGGYSLVDTDATI